MTENTEGKGRQKQTQIFEGKMVEINKERETRVLRQKKVICQCKMEKKTTLHVNSF